MSISSIIAIVVVTVLVIVAVCCVIVLKSIYNKLVGGNTNRINTLVVDTVIGSMKSQLEGKVSAIALDAARLYALRTANAAVPFPLRLAINALPASAVDTVLNKVQATVTVVVEGAVKKLADNGAISANMDVKKMVTEIVKMAVANVTGEVQGFIKGKKSAPGTDSVGEEPSKE